MATKTTTTTKHFVIFVVFVAFVSARGPWAVVVRAQNQFRDWKDTSLSDNPRLAPKQACAALVSQTGYDFSIVSATVTPAAADVPEYCRVVGLIQPEVRFEVNLPASWNGRLYMFGNGGYAGESIDAAARQNL